MPTFICHPGFFKDVPELARYGSVQNLIPREWKSIAGLRTVVIAGTGWNKFLSSGRITNFEIESPELSYTHFGMQPPNAATTHGAEIRLVRIDGGPPICVLTGRQHYYDTKDMVTNSLPLWIAIQLGVSRLIITNSAGAIVPELEVGKLVAIKDHACLALDPFFDIPQGVFSPHLFNGASKIYTRSLRDEAIAFFKGQQTDVQSADYYMVPGPTYETPAEVRMFKVMGMGLVGMSTATEATWAHAAGLEVVGLSCVTNPAASEGTVEPTQDEVTAALEAGRGVWGDNFISYLASVA